jgi:flagellar biosynthesis/type III secretory pathway protein FliH
MTRRIPVTDDMAGIIKASGPSEPATGGVLQAFHFDDVGQSYVSRVRSEASKIIADARREAAQIKAKATEEGRQAAMQAVEASLRTRLDQQLKNVLTALQQATTTIDQSRNAWQQHWERHAVELAAAIAARLCRRELSKQPEITLAWVRESLELAAGNAQITLRLNPDDHATLADRIAAITKQVVSLGTVQVVADATIAPGGCRVDTEFGLLDQQIEAQLARITEELLS